MEQQGKINKAKEEYQQGENKLMQERRRLNRELNKQKYQKNAGDVSMIRSMRQGHIGWSLRVGCLSISILRHPI